MNWINKDEQEMIKEWASFQGTQQWKDCYLPCPNEKQSSYWEVHDESNEICTYAFHTANELRQILERELSGETMKELVLPLTVAGMKGRKRMDEAVSQMLSRQEDSQHEIDETFAIPEFRYVF